MNHPWSRARITIRMTVVSAFAFATILTAALAIGLQYYFGSRLAEDVTRQLYTTTSSGVAAELRNIGDTNRNVLELLAENTALVEDDAETVRLDTFTRLMRQNPLFYGVYLGRSDGSFYELINLNSNPRARDALQASPQDRWVVLEIDGQAQPRQRRYRYLDNQLQLQRERSEPTDFDAAGRPWYLRAVTSGGVHVSEPYIFAQLGVPGQTSSKRIADTETVVAIDLTLESISRFLGALDLASYSEALLFNRRGEVIASSASHMTPSQLPMERLLAIADDQTQQERLIELELDGEPFYAYAAPLASDREDGLRLGIISPRGEVLGPFLKQVRLSIMITAGLLLLLLPLSWFFAGPIVNPVRQLALENRKVQRREYDTVKPVPSHVAELDDLSGSMMTMVGAIQEHERAQDQLMDSIIKLIAQAIDDKSPYTGGHCERVPELAIMLAESASSSKDGPFQDFCLETEDQWREYRTAAWLHDCGKITTPEHVVDKGSKLELIYNRIHEIRTRFEVLHRDAEIDYWQQLANGEGEEPALRAQLEQRQRQLQEDFAFVAVCNVGGEFLDPDKLARLKQIAGTTWTRHFDSGMGLSPAEEARLRSPPAATPAREQLLEDRPEHIVERAGSTEFPEEFGIRMDIPDHMYNQGELYNLSISRGTLTPEDRFKISEHMISTIKMLEGLPFPAELSNVPRMASTHHETMDGTGYPRMLSGDELSIQERMLAIADVFEALTASDRPYKKAKTVAEAVDILHKMVRENHLDRDCFELFIRSGVYQRYGERFLTPEQRDPIDTARYLC